MLMKKFTLIINKYEKVITILLTIVLIFITWRIGNVANDISKKQTNSIELQTNILDQQTKILRKQTDLQSYALDFDRDKFRDETYNQNKQEIDKLYEKITDGDALLTAVHNKVRNNEKVWDVSNKYQPRYNLMKYIDEFEGIGILYCSGRIEIQDVASILSDALKSICNSDQVSRYVQNTKSGLSALCLKTHPKSKMAEWSKNNRQKCDALN